VTVHSRVFCWVLCSYCCRKRMTKNDRTTLKTTKTVTWFTTRTTSFENDVSRFFCYIAVIPLLFACITGPHNWISRPNTPYTRSRRLYQLTCTRNMHLLHAFLRKFFLVQVHSVMQLYSAQVCVQELASKSKFNATICTFLAQVSWACVKGIIPFWTRNWSHIATHLLVVVLLLLMGRPSSNKAKAPSFQIGLGWNLAELFFK